MDWTLTFDWTAHALIPFFTFIVFIGGNTKWPNSTQSRSVLDLFLFFCYIRRKEILSAFYESQLKYVGNGDVSAAMGRHVNYILFPFSNFRPFPSLVGLPFVYIHLLSLHSHGEHVHIVHRRWRQSKCHSIENAVFFLSSSLFSNEIFRI